MKPLIIVEQNEVLKKANEEMQKEKKDHSERMIKIWDTIDEELASLNLIQKDEDGDYPNLKLKEGVIYLAEKEDDSPVHKFKIFLENMAE